ncbi:MAG TPA: hypothetical protein VIM65_23540 [Cyclobacteriaceae bacterium]
MKLVAQWTLVTLLLSGCSAVVVDRPADPQVVIIPEAPEPGLVWINDSWTYDYGAREYRPARGHWEKPRRRSAMWVDGYWIQTRRGWKYIKGHWRY